MKFRLTTGENGTAFGKQSVLLTGEAENAIEFLRICKADAETILTKEDAASFFYNTWVDAGTGTIPVPVASLLF